MKMRGHALLYHLATPGWFDASVENPRAVMENHIRKKALHFKGRIHSWDVVNEVLDSNSTRADGLSENVFLKLCGEDYIERAFMIAAEADPHALRVFSDAPFEMRGPFANRKRELTLAYLNKLIRRNIPIQYIGIHGHLHANLDARAFDTFLKTALVSG